MKKRALPILLVMALLIAALTVTALAAETPVAPNEVSQYANTEMKGKFGPEYPVIQHCPVCNSEEKWYPLDKGMTGTGVIDYNHYYLLADINHTGSGFYRIPSGKTVCMYMNGYNISSEAYIAVQVLAGTFNVIGNGTETISGGGLNSPVYGTAFDIRGGTLNLYGVNVTKTPGTTRSGPTIGMNEAAGTLNVYNGTTISGGTNSGNGGNIGMYYEGCTVNIYGGTVTGGKATDGNGGNIYCGYGTFKMTGGTISNGTASAEGGNVYIVEGVSVTINNQDGGVAPALINGTANATSGGGGNMRATVASGMTMTIEDLNVSNGMGAYSGNLAFTGAGNIVLKNMTISNGKGTYGANIYTSATGSVQMDNVSMVGGCGKDGGNASVGGSVYISKSRGVTLTNCTFGSATAGSKAATGGTMYLEAPTTMNNCTVTNGTATGKGGNINASAALTINGCEISNGTSSGGGNIHMTSGTLTIDKYGDKKTVISGGYGGSGQGGNISCGGNTVIKNATISGGTTTTAWGGNIYIDSAKITIGEGATIQNGTASGGGNLNAYAATVDIDDATFIGGTANNSGTYMGGGSLRLWNCTATVDNTTFTGGTAGDYVGGNYYGYGGSNKVTFTGCTFENGTADTGANAYIKSATTFADCVFNVAENANGTGNQIYVGAQANLDGCTFNGGTIYADANVVAKDTAINALTIRQGALTLKGATDIVGATLSQYPDAPAAPSYYGNLLVDSTYTGTANITGMANGSATYGGQLASSYTANGDFTGKVVLSCVSSSEKPWAFNDNGALVVGNARTVKGKEITWHKNNAMAALNYGDADLMYPGNHELPLVGGNYVVNVCGWNLNVTGTGTVTFFDSANKNFKDYGSVTVAETVTVANEFETFVDGLNYYMVEKDGALSFHRMGLKVSGVSIRPGNAGIYYTSAWQCDELLASKIESFGVAVSLANQPGIDFRRDGDTLYTKFDKDEFEAGKDVTSVLIDNILEVDAENNQARAEMPIYATAYIIFEDGTDAGCVVVDDGEVNYSLKQVVELIDSNEAVYNQYKTLVDDFYTKWETVMGAWDLKNIGKN